MWYFLVSCFVTAFFIHFFFQNVVLVLIFYESALVRLPLTDSHPLLATGAWKIVELCSNG